MSRAIFVLCLLSWCLIAFTSGFYDQSIECGWPGITRPECMRRTGCEWSPVYGTGYSGYSCFYPRSQVTTRSQCGPENTTPYECTHDRDCLYEKSRTGNPSCFHKKSLAGSSETDQSIDCGFPGMNATECPIQSGCHWRPSNGQNWCYFPRNQLVNQKTVNCGGDNLSGVECTKTNHCLYDTLATESTSKCFYKPGESPSPQIPQGFEAVETATQSVLETRSIVGI